MHIPENQNGYETKNMNTITFEKVHIVFKFKTTLFINFSQVQGYAQPPH